MLWVLIRSEYPQHMFLLRSGENYPQIITKSSSDGCMFSAIGLVKEEYLLIICEYYFLCVHKTNVEGSHGRHLIEALLICTYKFRGFMKNTRKLSQYFHQNLHVKSYDVCC